jgi:hypothetical protein
MTTSSEQLLTKTRPSASAARPATSMGVSVSDTMGDSSSITSSRHVPAAGAEDAGAAAG